MFAQATVAISIRCIATPDGRERKEEHLMLIASQLILASSDSDMRVFLLILLLIAITLIIAGCVIAVVTLHRARQDRLMNGEQ